MTSSSRRNSSFAAILATALAIVGCGGDAPVDKAEVTLKLRVEGAPERRLIDQIYAQALKSAGYDVKLGGTPKVGLTSFLDEIKSGRLAGFPQYLSTALFYDFGIEIDDIPAHTQAAYKRVKAQLEKEDLTAFPPTPYGIENAVGMLRRTAEKRGLQTVSDLASQRDKLRAKGPTYCHVSVECLGGIERHYPGTQFQGITYEPVRTPELTWWRAEPDWRYEVLEDGEAGASFLYNTDGRLASEAAKFVILENDKDIFPASNFAWITSEDVVDEAGPDYEKTILNAQKGLTLGVVRRLNAKLEESKTPAAVAAEYLESIDRVP